MNKNKVLYVNSAFPLNLKDDLAATSDSIDSIFIEGYASTCDVDRTGDVVSATAWKSGLTNYLKNPIILAFHDHDDPVGRMVEHRVDSKGLWIKARISAAAEIFNLVKDNVLTAFSIGFKVMDAEYDSESEIFMIKEVELVEISIVSVPCNQNTLFSLAKAFDNAEDYTVFKKQFAKPTGNVPKVEVKSTTPKEWIMSPEEIKQMLEAATKQAAEQATEALLTKQAAEAAELKHKADAEAELNAKVAAAVAVSIKSGESGAERLLSDITKRFEEQSASLAGLESSIKEKASELQKLQSSKMSFADRGNTEQAGYDEREKAILLSKITGKAVADTAFGRALLEKSGAHIPTGNTIGGIGGTSVWETEVSLNMESEIRRRLVVTPVIRQVTMKTNVMTIPVNPEAGYATWVTNAQFGTTASGQGTSATHALKEITLNSYKVATAEYLAYEEEEDSLLMLLPIIRDAMVRRTARSIDKAFLLGAGSGSDPVKGLGVWAGTSSTVAAVATKVTVANLISLRKDLGALGLDPASVTFFVNTDVYYDLLQDSTFQTMNQVGPQATLLTGQIGQIGGSPVLVSGELPAKFSAANTAATTTNIGAIALYAPNFIVGNQRGLRFDTQELVETQRRILVASMRTGLMQVSSNLGAGVAALRYTT
jgi:HK97 family phage prohead protease/HK97 family phage major capsid protein